MTRNALQFKISLQDVAGWPTVWRRIMISADSSFWDLHVAIQDAMGWFDKHLHEFTIRRNNTMSHFGLPEDDDTVLFDWDHRVTDHVDLSHPAFSYWYDFGDDWQHDVVLEDVLAVPSHQKLPACIAGEMACPPEDCGGLTAYEELLRALEERYHPERRELKRWLRVTGYKNYDPYRFDPSRVRFSDAMVRLRNVHVA